MFADEIKEDDEKFTPNPGINDSEVSSGILLQKLFWPALRKNCSSDQENFLKFEAEGREFGKCLRSLKQFIQTVKGQNNFW